MDPAYLHTLTEGPDKEAYGLLKILLTQSASSDELYADFDTFLSFLSHKKSYVRTRGFYLCMAQARWDTEGKIEGSLDELLRLLKDPKPTVVRQCMAALGEAVLFRPKLCERITKALNAMDLSVYKESMSSLIEKDRQELLKKLN